MPGKRNTSRKSHKNSQKNPITYQNKDVVSKIFGEQMKEKSLSVYGLKIPKIKEVLPTNLPAVEANELRLDNLFRLEDGSIALVDYESVYKYKDKIKYLNYIVRTLKKNDLIENLREPLRMIVIYTGDIKKGTTNPSLDAGCLQFTVEEVFLSELDADSIEENISRRIQAGEPLSEEEQMQFVILPLVHAGKAVKQQCIRRCFELAKRIESSHMQIFLLSGLLVFTDKVIAKEDSERIKRWINMTQVGRLYEEEKQEALRELERKQKVEIKRINNENRKKIQNLKKEHRHTLQKSKQEHREILQKMEKESTLQNSRQIAQRMLEKGMSVADIQSVITNLSYDDIEALK